MSSFSAKPRWVNPRRHPQGAAIWEANPRLRLLPSGEIQPGVIKTSHVPQGGVLSSQVNFDSAIFAYDSTTCDPTSVTVSTGWSKLPNQPNDLRAYIGPTEYPLYAWVW